MLLRTPDLLCASPSTLRTFLQATDTLSAKDLSAKQAQHRVRDILSSGRATSFHRLFHQGIVILGQADELEDRWVSEGNVVGCDLSIAIIFLVMRNPPIRKYLNIRASMISWDEREHLIQGG